MNHRFFPMPVLALVLSLATAPTLSSQENLELGRMWTFENPPLAYLEEEYGFAPDAGWLDSLRMGSLRLGGESAGFCSASFVSPKGLIMTNNHCVRDAVSATNMEGPSLVTSGFYATSLENEYRLKTQADGWLTVSQLSQITEITDRVNEGIEDGDTEDEIKEKREANKEKIIAEAEESHPDLKPQVVSLYQGGIFQLYQYKTYDDLRLVCIPHLQTAHFGGDPDNFTFPRYSIDFAFVRAYENGEPADTTQHYFKWKIGGATEGELVFVPGNPGTTNRLNTVAQFEYQRDAQIPIVLELLTNRLQIFRSLIAQIPQIEEPYRTSMLSWENGEKAFTGNLNGLNDDSLMSQKTDAEAAFRARVDADPTMKEEYGSLWDDIAALAAEQKDLEAPLAFHSGGFLSVLHGAVQIVRAADPNESEKTREEASEGLAEFQWLDNVITVNLFADHLVRSRNWLAPDDPYLTSVFGGATDIRAIQANLLSSALANDVSREAALATLVGNWEAIQASEDPVIVAARQLAPLVRASEDRKASLDARQEALGAKIGRALFDCYGTKVSPDATMTPRFTDGRVTGYRYNGTLAPFRTTFYGLYGRNAEFDGEHPFDLPQIWLERRDQIDMTKAVNFVSTNDITGGNSGSVVVNQSLEAVGLIFDGNIESLSNDFVYRDEVARSVSVHVDGIMEALKKIYLADRVIEELIGK